ncbi:FAD-dependent oxidoreductase [Nakamurella sp. A5-74]|uniref:FAD-dependent oxidoreductase n=1 Tax=Nakamurella sp. A5-74 TaxID=3158264 RepID=A0AAU8DR99_9ACTN
MTGSSTSTSPTSLLIIGSGPAGNAAAKAYREGGGAGTVRIVTDEHHPPYDRPPLSKEYLRGESAESDLPLEDEGFYDQHDIELVLGAEVVALDTAQRAVRLVDGRRIGYESLLLATGSWSKVPGIDGADHADVVLLRSWDEGVTLRHRAEDARSAIVVGSGFIGCEAAVSLARRGLAVTMVTSESRPQAKRLGPDVAERIARWLSQDDVTLIGDARIASIEDGRVVVLENGDRHEADLVVLATGASPRTDPFTGAGLAMTGGRISVDEHLRTSDPHVFAAGDIAWAHHPKAGRSLAVEHWGDAEAMGAVVGTVVAGGEAAWEDVPGFFTGIGDRWLMYAAWGDGYDVVRFEGGDPTQDSPFTAWYLQDGVVVGVLAYNSDDDYERGKQLIAEGAGLD